MSKAVRFDYFKVNLEYYNQERDVYTRELCDLSALFEALVGQDIADRSFEANGEIARVQQIEFIEDLWEIHFLRIRKKDFPLRANDNGDIGYFDDFSDEEGFGEEVSVIFDPQTHVLMMRRNMFSIAPSAISNYFTTLVNVPASVVVFAPLIHPHSRGLMRRGSLIRGASITIADVKNANENTKRSLHQMIRGTEDMEESVNITIKIGIAQKGSKKHSNIPIYEELEMFADDPNAVSVEVRQKADEDAKVEYVDLIKNRLFEYYSFSEKDINTESRNILHGTVVTKMIELYNLRKIEIETIYN